jgi:hypothetical protein
MLAAGNCVGRLLQTSRDLGLRHFLRQIWVSPVASRENRPDGAINLQFKQA